MKYYLTIYRKNEDRHKIWWKEFDNEEKAHVAAMLCKTLLDTFSVKVVDTIIPNYIKNSNLIELNNDYIPNIIQSLVNSRCIEGLSVT